jgi:hypothetical protein
VLTGTTRRRLDIQGFERVDENALAPVVPWLRLAFGLCAAMAGVGTAMASPTILLLLVPVASLAAVFPVHPFDLIYNHGIRFVTGTSPLPRRGAPARVACGLGAVWRGAPAWVCHTGHPRAGYPRRAAHQRGGPVVNTDICIPASTARYWIPRQRDDGTDITIPAVAPTRRLTNSSRARKHDRSSRAKRKAPNPTRLDRRAGKRHR